MQILSNASNWVRRQIQTPGDDFTPGAEAPEPNGAKTVVVATAAGAGVGAVVGGGAAYREMSQDTVYVDWETTMLPLGASGPTPGEVFGSDLGGFEQLVSSHSQSASAGRENLQYLSFLKYQSPHISNSDLTGIYNSLESQFGNDTQVRDSLNMIAAHMNRHDTTPNEAVGAFKNYFGYTDDFDKATNLFLEDQGLSEDFLTETKIGFVQKHTSPIGHLGMAKAVTLGVAGGMAVGAASGLVVGLGINLYQKIVK